MKQFLLGVGLVTWVSGLTAADAPLTKETLSSSKLAKESYSIGVNMGKSLASRFVEVDVDILSAGIRHALANEGLLLNDEEVRDTLIELQRDMQVAQQKRLDEAAKQNLAAAEAFLAENRKKDGIVTTPTGLQYRVLVEGDGNQPTTDDTVVVHYRGTLTDGTEFDSSIKTGKPFSTKLNQVIQGWRETLPLMKVGSKYEIFVPPALAYGERGSRGIPPNSALVFEIELIGIRPTEVPEPPSPVTSDIIKVPSAEELKRGAKIEIIKKEDLDKYRQDAEQNKEAPKQ